MRRWRYFCLFLLLSTAALANPLDIRQYFKGILENQLSGLVSKNVTIGRLQGNIYQRIILTDVAITEPDGTAAALIGRAEVEYSLKNIILQRFDILSNIREIKVYDAKLLVKRDRQDNWNYSFAGSPADPRKKTPQPKMRVTFANSDLRFIDEKGFGRALPRRYDQQAVLNGWLDIDGSAVVFSAEAAVGRDTPVRLSGEIGQGYSLTVSAANIRLAEHGWYVLSFSDYGLHSGRADLNARIRAVSLNAVPGGEVDLRLSGAEVQPGDYLLQPLKNISGEVRWRGQTVRFVNLRADAQDAALTLNGSVVLVNDPVFDMRAEIGGLDLQKKYSRYFSLDNISGAGAARLALRGPLSRLAEQGELNIENLKYADAALGDVAVSVSLENNKGELVFHSPGQATGNIAFQLDGGTVRGYADIETALEFYQQELGGLSGAFVWQDNKLRASGVSLILNGRELLASADYAAGSYRVRVADNQPEPWLKLELNGDARHNIALNIERAELDLRDSQLWQKYFPDGSGRLGFAGALFWRDKQFSLDGAFNAADLCYSDLSVPELSGHIAGRAGDFVLTDCRLRLADSLVTGSADVKLAAGNAPLWQRLNVSADAAAEADLKAAYNFWRRAENLYLDVKQRLVSAQEHRQISPAVLPELPLYTEYGDSLLQKFTEFMPSAAVTESLALDIEGRLSGRLALLSRGGSLNIAADLRIADGALQGQRAALAVARIRTDESARISANLEFSGLSIAGVQYEGLSLNAAAENGMLNFQEVSLRQNKREARHILSGSFPLFGLWDERYRRQDIDLRLNLSGADIVLFTPFVRGLDAVNSTGNIALVLRGTLDNPLLSAEKLELGGTRISLDNDYFQSALVRRAALELKDNQLTIAALEILLRSGSQYAPPLNLSGSVSLKGWSLLKPAQLVLRSDLSLDDARGQLDIRNLYHGGIELKDLTLRGDLLVPLNSEARAALDRRIRANEPVGPLLKGDLGFTDGTLYLFRLERDLSVKSEKNLSAQLDLNLNIRKDVRALSSDSLLLTGEFSSFLNQINVSLRDENPPVKIGGSTNFARIDGRIFLADGYLSFLNRKFTLLEYREQEKYFLTQSLRRPQENYLEFAVSEKFTLEPRITLVAQTTVYDTRLVSAAPLAVSADLDEETQTVTTESDYLVFVNGSIFDLSSIAFEKYQKEGSLYALDGEPYVLRDQDTGRTIDQASFQELTYAISPPFIKSAIALARGTGAQTINDATRDTLRDLTITEINLLARSLLKPVERAAAESAGLYDVRIRRDFGQDTSRTDPETEAASETLFGLELVKELWRERLFFSVDTSFDRNLQTKDINVTVSSYKLTWRISRDYFFDELSLSAGEELDIMQREYIPVLSLELLHSF
ncbi:MAG: hypothetical protein LBD99_01880 [Candidatus Margulisbacteria bacterium]|jgi:hypothetical protein|nr:hypothetical protein [Candidatus Margulisiibacteriota bacterium]